MTKLSFRANPLVRLELDNSGMEFIPNAKPRAL